MRRSTTSLLAASLALAAVAMTPATTDDNDDSAGEEAACHVVDHPDTSDDTTDDVTLCEQQLFIRAGDTPLSNASSAVFSPEAPTAAPVGGAGLGGSVTDIAVQGDSAHGLEVNGTFTGALDTIDVEVHLLMPNGASGSHGTTPTVELDGYELGGQLVDTTVEAGPDGTAVATFRISDLLPLWDALGYSYDPATEHTLRLNLSPFYIGDDGAYLYDGTDVPSHVVLNAAG